MKFAGKDRLVTDGPFAETKELIAGFWMWKCNSLAEAIEWVKRSRTRTKRAAKSKSARSLKPRISVRNSRLSYGSRKNGYGHKWKIRRLIIVGPVETGSGRSTTKGSRTYPPFRKDVPCTFNPISTLTAAAKKPSSFISERSAPRRRCSCAQG